MLHLVHAIQAGSAGGWGRRSNYWFRMDSGRLWGTRGFFVVDLLLLIVVLKALQILLVKVASDLWREWEFIGEVVIGIEVRIALVDF